MVTRDDAREIARGLMQRLKAGELQKVGIDEIRAAIRVWAEENDIEAWRGPSDWDEQLVCRAVVNEVG